jgi:hypothetical protein
MTKVDDFQLVRIVAEHGRKLERIETLGTSPIVGGVHHTLTAFTPSVAVGCFGRLRLLPGAGLRYRVVSWAIGIDINGSVVVDILKGAGYPPATSMCAFNRPSLVGGRSSTGGVGGWNSTTINHGDWLILNIFSYALAAELGFSMELVPEAQ